MPDKNNQHTDPQVDRFIQDHPEYKPFFETFPVPQSKMRQNPYFNRYEEYMKNNEAVLKDKAKLNYYSEQLNKQLESKFPKEFKEITSQYGWNPDKPSTSETRVQGADSFAKKNSNFYLSPEEQQKALGDDYSTYNALRATYGKDLNLIGQNDDPKKPETWNFGARHAVAFNPVTATLDVVPEKDTQQTKDQSKFVRTQQYDPKTGFSGFTKYSNIDPENPQENASNIKTRRLDKVDYIHDPDNRVENEDGTVDFKTPGFHYYKYYDDGTKEEVDKNSYQTLKMFNTLPAYLKSKYIEEMPEGKPEDSQESYAAK
jgi:hypothetical protein